VLVGDEKHALLGIVRNRSFSICLAVKEFSSALARTICCITIKGIQAQLADY